MALVVAGLAEQETHREGSGRFCDSVVARLTRRGPRALLPDKAADLQARAGLANQINADAFVSIHCNSYSDEMVEGFEVWTSPGYTPADTLATITWRRFKENFPDRRMRLDMSDGDPDKESRFRVLVATAMPAILVELGFISNAREELLLASPDWQLLAAQTIAGSVLEFFDQLP